MQGRRMDDHAGPDPQAATAPGHFGHSALARRIAAEVADSLRPDAARHSPLNPARGGRLGPALVVGVFGEWGSGKSHLLAEVGHELAALSGAPVAPAAGEPLSVTVQVPFNAWRYEREPVLLVPMLKVAEQALHDAVEALVPDSTRRNERLRDHAALFSELVKGIYSNGGRELANAWLAAQGTPLQLPELSKAPAPAQTGWLERFFQRGSQAARQGEVATPIRALESLYFNFFDYLKGITGRNPRFLRNVHDRLAQQGRGELWDRVHRVLEWVGTGETDAASPLLVNLVFIVDDLDRCLPEKAVEVLEAIKLFLDVEGCAFVLAVDEEVVERGIAHRYQVYSQGSGATAPITGAEYLEKLIHLPIRLPRPGGAEAQGFLADQWPDWYALPPESDGRRHPNELAQLVATVTPPVPRKLQRVTSLLQLNEPLAGQLEGQGGTPLAAIEQRRWLVLVCALQLFAPGLFRYLRVQGAWLLRELVTWRVTMRLNDLDALRTTLRSETQAVDKPWELRNAHARERVPGLLQEVWHSRSGFSLLTWLEQVQEQAQRADADDKTLQRLLLLAVATPAGSAPVVEAPAPATPAPEPVAPPVEIVAAVEVPAPTPEPAREPPSPPPAPVEAAPASEATVAATLPGQRPRARLDNEFALWEPLAVGDAGGIERAISREGAALAGRLLPLSLVDRWCEAARDPSHWLHRVMPTDPLLQTLEPLLAQGDVIRLARAGGQAGWLQLFGRPGWADQVDGSGEQLIAWTRAELIGVTTPMHMRWDEGQGLVTPRAWISPVGLLHESEALHMVLLADGEFGLSLRLVVQGVELGFRWMEPGVFLMGRQNTPGKTAGPPPGPQHAVHVSRGFWMAEVPCTVGLLNVLPSTLPVEAVSGLPATRQTWHAADGVVGRLNTMLPSGWSADLPSEAEWEYACRAGTGTQFWWGDRPAADLAPFGLQARVSRPVRSYAPNPWGLFDMPGALREWCLDDARTYEDMRGLQLADPCGSIDGDHAVVRGGLEWARGAPDRERLPKDTEADDLGFRLCLRYRPTKAAEG